MLKVKNLTKLIDNQKILEDISFSIKKGDVLVVFGPSGGGKTTLLKCIKGMEEPNSGSIVFKEKDKNKIGIVFQDFHIWDHMTVLQNLMLAPKEVQKREHTEIYEESLNVLEKVELMNKINHYPDQLSGGQKQRAALARSLMMKPKLLLLDEITSSLDINLENKVLKIIKKLSDEGITMIITTHNLNFAKRIGDKFLFIEEGKAIEFGNKQVLINPKKRQTKDFLKNHYFN
jgi:ABC-type polar amino acid transport system ATPase subunit